MRGCAGSVAVVRVSSAGGRREGAGGFWLGRAVSREAVGSWQAAQLRRGVEVRVVWCARVCVRGERRARTQQPNKGNPALVACLHDWGGRGRGRKGVLVAGVFAFACCGEKNREKNTPLEVLARSSLHAPSLTPSCWLHTQHRHVLCVYLCLSAFPQTHTHTHSHTRTHTHTHSHTHTHTYTHLPFHLSLSLQ